MAEKQSVKFTLSKAVRYSGEPFLYATLNEKPITERDVSRYRTTTLIEEEVSIDRLKNALNMDIPSDVIRLKFMVNKAKDLIEQMLRNKQISSLITKKTERDIGFWIKNVEKLDEEIIS